MQWNNELVDEYGVKFDLTVWEDESMVWLNHFIIPRKYWHQGLGTKIMNQFTDWLDNKQFNSKLLVANCYGTPEEVLVKFYGKFGYVRYPSKKGIYMERKHK